MDVPRKVSQFDAILCESPEFLGIFWSTGEGGALASDSLAALQDTSPKLKGQNPAAWRILETWHINELPNRAPPFPEKVFQALVGFFYFPS